MNNPFSRPSALGLALILAVVAGCITEPITGRKQFILVPASQDLQLGVQEFDKMKKDLPINRDPAINALVKRVGQRIAGVAEMPGAQWEFVVFESKEANAFCLPGGKVGIYTGILPITKDEGGLATVIGHEVAHAKARHGAERMTTAIALQTGGAVLQSAASQVDPAKQQAMATIYGLGAQLGVALPHSRSQESSADWMGLVYMARAGYNPEHAVGFWERFADFNQRAGGSTPWFLRTHPLDANRIAELKRLMPQAKAEFRPQ